MENLPKNVAKQWSKWGRNKNYLLSDTSVKATFFEKSEFQNPMDSAVNWAHQQAVPEGPQIHLPLLIWKIRIVVYLLAKNCEFQNPLDYPSYKAAKVQIPVRILKCLFCNLKKKQTILKKDKYTSPLAAKSRASRRQPKSK